MKPSMRSVLVMLFLVSTLFLKAQSSELRKANSLFDRGEYFAALQLYNQLDEEGEELDIPTKINMAHCYFQLNNIDAAFERFAELEQHLSGDDLLTYALTTHKFGFYSGAVDLYRKARPQLPGKQGHIDEMIRACEWAEANLNVSKDFLINPLDITIYGQSFGIQFYNEGIVYSSASPDSDSKQKDKQGMNFQSLYYSDFNDGQVSNTRVFSKNLISPYHVGAISFTSDYKTMYYTKVVRVRGGNNILKVFSVQYNGSEWGNEVDLGINSDDFDNAHPAVSPDDKFLYFTSNRPGGYGGKDLYMVERRSVNSYGTPRNLGPKINTFGDDQWPFISQDNKLYFSSDGHMGFGGWDIFVSEFVNGEWNNVQNMMFPFNSAKDDFGYVMNRNNPKQGFISTNRSGDGSVDAIFYVQPREQDAVEDEDVVVVSEPEIPVELPVEVPVEVSEPKVDLTIFPRAFGTILTSTFNGGPIGGATIEINDAFTGASVARGSSLADGKISLDIPDAFRKDGQEFEIIITKPGDFQDKRLVANIMELEELGQGGVTLTPVFSDDTGLNEIGEMIIPYVGNEITPEGYQVLDKLAAFLINNPHVVIKLNGLTDARGNRLTNLNTSQTLAEKAEAYLLTKGVNDQNVIPRGYGERYLRNRCARGKLCSEEEHLANRRIEVVVWRLLK